MRAQACAPCFNSILWRNQVRHVIRHAVYGRCARERQAEQRTLQIERGQSVVSREHRGCAFDLGEQWLQLALDAQQHLGALGGNTLRVAAELDGVAETLLGLQQDSLAFDGLVANPDGAGDLAVGVGEFGHVPARVIVAPASFIVTHQQETDTAVHLGGDDARRQRECPVIACHGVVMAMQALQRVPTVADRSGITRRKLDCAIIGGEGLVVAVKLLQRAALAEPGGNVVVIQDQCLFVTAKSFSLTTQLAERMAAAHVGADMRGIKCDRHIEAAQRLRMMVQFGQHQAAIVMRIDVVGTERDSAGEVGVGLFEPRQSNPGIGAIKVRLRVIGIDRQRLVETLGRVVVALLRREREATVDPCRRHIGAQ